MDISTASVFDETHDSTAYKWDDSSDFESEEIDSVEQKFRMRVADLKRAVSKDETTSHNTPSTHNTLKSQTAKPTSAAAANFGAALNFGSVPWQSTPQVFHARQMSGSTVVNDVNSPRLDFRPQDIRASQDRIQDGIEPYQLQRLPSPNELEEEEEEEDGEEEGREEYSRPQELDGEVHSSPSPPPPQEHPPQQRNAPSQQHMPPQGYIHSTQASPGRSSTRHQPQLNDLHSADELEGEVHSSPSPPQEHFRSFQASPSESSSKRHFFTHMNDRGYGDVMKYIQENIGQQPKENFTQTLPSGQEAQTQTTFQTTEMATQTPAPEREPPRSTAGTQTLLPKKGSSSSAGTQTPARAGPSSAAGTQTPAPEEPKDTHNDNDELEKLKTYLLQSQQGKQLLDGFYGKTKPTSNRKKTNPIQAKDLPNQKLYKKLGLHQIDEADAVDVENTLKNILVLLRVPYHQAPVIIPALSRLLYQPDDCTQFAAEVHELVYHQQMTGVNSECLEQLLHHLRTKL